MLEPLLKDVRSGTHEGLLQAARRAFTLAFAALALPGLPLGALYAVLGRPPRLDWPEVAGLLVLAATLGALTLHLAQRAAREPGQKPPQAALTAAIQAATAPAIPFLLGCAFLTQPLALLGFWALGSALFVVARSRLAGWVRAPEA